MLKSFILLVIILTSSCSNKIEQSNEAFLSDYGDSVKEIHSRREAFSNGVSETHRANSWNDPGEDIGVSGSSKWRSALIDTSKITLPPPPESFTPDMETLLKDRNNKKLPNDIFEVSYNLENYPDSYAQEGINFDDIRVPQYDSFGISTDLGDKEYILAGQVALQKNVDYLNHASNRDDKKISRVLVLERKELKSHKIATIVKVKKEVVADVKEDDTKDSNDSGILKQMQNTAKRIIKLQ